MDKNNDIQVNKISKWDAAPESIKELKKAINGTADELEMANEWEQELTDILEKVLDDYNELEAKHNSDCGLISELEEDIDKANKNNVELKKALGREAVYSNKCRERIDELKTDIDDLECDVAKYKKKHDNATRYISGLTKSLNDFGVEFHWINGDPRYSSSDYMFVEAEKRVAKLVARLKDSGVKAIWDYETETWELQCSGGVNLYSRLIGNEIWITQLESENAKLKKENDKLKTEKKRISEKLKSAEGRCEVNYISYNQEADSLRALQLFLKKCGVPVKYGNDATWGWDFESSAWDDTPIKDCKLIDKCRKLERRSKMEKQYLENILEEMESNLAIKRIYLITSYEDRAKYITSQVLARIKQLEKENKDLKYTIDRNEDFGEYVGKQVAECIREGWEHNLYKLHPYTRIDIHVEQITDMPFAFNHCAIPNVAVMFNNTQTEMERDTAQHECKELNRKIKELVKENEDLRTTLKMCEQDANTAKNLCDGVAFHAERARNKTPLFNDAYGDHYA